MIIIQLIDSVQLSDFEYESYIYGPGKRFVIWVQGCSIHCFGCWNQDLWDFTGGESFLIDDIIARISAVSGLDGITLLGGEPLDQASAIHKMVRTVKSLGLSVMLYTGYELHEIFSDSVKREVYQLSDIVVSGRFDLALRDLKLKWRGSSNQVVTVNNNYIDYFDEQKNEVEVHFSDDGRIKIIGYPDKKMINELMKHEFITREAI